MRLQANEPFDPRTPFSRADAVGGKIKVPALLGPQYQRVFHGVYLAAGVRLDAATQAAAALAVSPREAYASHTTAAKIWGVVVPDEEHTHVSVPPGARRTERRGIKAHQASASEPVERNGLRLSRAVECIREMAAIGVSLVDLVIAGDSLLKLEQFTLAELEKAATGWRGRGAALGRRAVRLMRIGVDSPMESRLRLLLVLAGLPEPEVNYILRNADGSWSIRLDLCYRHLKLAVEYDGRQHAESTAQWQRDLRRREELDRLGWRIIVITAPDVYQAPQETLERVSALLSELGHGRRVRSYRPEWRRYFPSQDDRTR